jgi:uncharacterized membrane protein
VATIPVAKKDERPPPAPARNHTLDLLRGIVMLLMTMDHARDYAGLPGFPPDPMDLSAVGPALFMMRWLTHFCAPVFALLMGTSVYLSSLRRSPAELTKHLFVRGLVLIVVEFTLVDWGWSWNPFWPRKFFQVIGALGCAMIALAYATRLGRKVTFITGCLIVTLHNLTDGVHFPADSAMWYLWSFAHQRNVLPLGGGYEMRTSYPFLTIVGVAFLGHGLGQSIAEGDRRLGQLGAALVGVFLVLRLLVGYGDPNPFRPQSSTVMTILAALNVTKYPLSLQFIAMTLGPAFLFLRWVEHPPIRLGWITALGRMPLPYYVLHLWLLHGLALVGALAAGYPLSSMNAVAHYGGRPPGFGFPLWVTIPFAAITVVLTYPLCRWYERQKSGRRWWFTAYL